MFAVCHITILFKTVLPLRGRTTTSRFPTPFLFKKCIPFQSETGNIFMKLKGNRNSKAKSEHFKKKYFIYI